MLIVLSPSKTIDFDKESPLINQSAPLFLKEAQELIAKLSEYSVEEIMEREKLSFKLAQQTYEYIHTYSLSLSKDKEAIYAYTGHVFDKLDAVTLDDAAMGYLNSHLRIFSALYGVLTPSDSIRAYRLDMNSRLVPRLYDYWRDKVTRVVATDLRKHKNILINLASAEYFKMLNLKKLDSSIRIITPIFQQEKNGKLVTNSMYAKQARGAMVRFLAMHQIEDPKYLKAFTDEGYYFDAEMSDEHTWYFLR